MRNRRWAAILEVSLVGLRLTVAQALVILNFTGRRRVVSAASYFQVGLRGLSAVVSKLADKAP